MRAGAGPAMLLLHGEGGPAFSTALMERLAQDFEVILPEHPGFGGGEVPPWLDSVSDLANFYLDYLEGLDCARVHLVGVALGGWIAADLAVRNATRLASLTLVAAPGIHVKGMAQIDPFMRNEEQSIRDLFHDPELADQAVAAMLRPETEDIRLGNHLIEARLSWQPRFHDPLLQKWLHRIRVPTLIAWGENDRLLPADYAAAWQRLIPGARLVLLSECGHAPALEKTAELATAIRDFCSKESVTA
jgi:pimeloyl-ACP methyl ester carboxylesterase